MGRAGRAQCTGGLGPGHEPAGAARPVPVNNQNPMDGLDARVIVPGATEYGEAPGLTHHQR